MVPTITVKIDDKTLIVLAAIIFIPIGYILSVFQQLLYLSCPGFGMYKAAKRKFIEEAGIKAIRIAKKNVRRKYEPTYESDMLLKTMFDAIKIDMEYVRDWTKKRMDVVAINSTLIVATILSIAIVFIFPRIYFGWSPQYTGFKSLFIFVVTFLVLSVMVLSTIVLRRQIIEVIVGLYRNTEKKKYSGKIIND